jgi:hypothetical protein
VKEADFQKWIVDVAQSFGWRVWHVPTPMKPIGRNTFVPDSRGRGLADLILLHDDPPRLIFAEVKNETGKLSDEQSEFLRLSQAVAHSCVPYDPSPSGRVVAAYLWRPGVEDLIEMILRGGAREVSEQE